MKFRDLLNKIRKDKQNPSEYFRSDDNFRFEVANLITEARIYKGITQEELSIAIQTKQPSIARWEAAESLPSLRSLKKIADALGTYLIPPKFGFMENIKINESAHSVIKYSTVSWLNNQEAYLLRPYLNPTEQSEELVTCIN